MIRTTPTSVMTAAVPPVATPMMRPVLLSEEDDSATDSCESNGVETTVMPKAVDAAEDELKLLAIALLTWVAMLADAVISAVMMTDAAVTVMATSDAVTPAIDAKLACSPLVSA